MPNIIDHFIEEQRLLELKKYPPIAPESKPKQYNDTVVHFLNLSFPENAPIQITVNLSSIMSYGAFFHYHDFFELVYIYRGECIHRFPMSEQPLKQHDILLLNPNTVHSPYSTSKDICMFNIMISKSLFENSMLSLISDKQIISSFVLNCLYQVSKARDYLYFTEDEYGNSSRIIEAMITEFIQKDLNYEDCLESLLKLLFTNLSRQYKKTHDSGLEPDLNSHYAIADILAYMDKNYATVTLNELALHFGYSTRHISRLIKQYTGKNYAEIIQYFKLEKARYYLYTTNEPILQVMEKVGFYSPNHFYHIFKAHYLMSPAEYRKYVQSQKTC